MLLKINSYLNKPIQDNKQVSNREFIYNELLKNFKSKNFSNMKADDIILTFNIFDELYFRGDVTKYIINNNIGVDFISSAQLTKTAGKICVTRDYKYFTFTISSNILMKLFKDNNDTKSLGGLLCRDRIECYIITFEHEFIHFILNLAQMNKYETSHGPMFKKLIQNMFGHSRYTHELLLEGDAVKIKDDIECLKNEIKIGDKIITKKLGDRVFSGVVVKINPTSVKIKTEDNQLWNIKYIIIAKVN